MTTTRLVHGETRRKILCEHPKQLVARQIIAGKKFSIFVSYQLKKKFELANRFPLNNKMKYKILSEKWVSVKSYTHIRLAIKPRKKLNR